jgi:hypothetical protein
MGNSIKFYDLSERINNVIVNKNENNYLNFVFEMGIHGFKIQENERNTFYDSFINGFCDLYNSYKEEGKNEKEAKFGALYHITKRFIIG